MFHYGDDEAEECDEMLYNEDLIVPVSDGSDRTNIHPKEN